MSVRSNYYKYRKKSRKSDRKHYKNDSIYSDWSGGHKPKKKKSFWDLEL